MRKWIGPALWILLTLAGLALLWEIRSAVMLFGLAVFFATAIRPLHRWLSVRGLNHTVAVIAVYASILIGLVVILALMTPGLQSDFESGVNNIIDGYNQLQNQIENGSGSVIVMLRNLLPTGTSADGSILRDLSTALGETLLQATAGFLSAVGRLGLVLVVSLYWSLDQQRLERYAIGLLPLEQRRETREIWSAIQAAIGSQLRAEIVLSLMSGFLLWLVGVLMGSNYPMLIGLWGGLARLIPWVGPLLSALPLLLTPVPSLAIRLGTTILSIAILVGLEQAFWHRWRPHRRPSRFLTAVTILVLGYAFGIVGVILAASVAAAIHTVLLYLSALPSQPQAEDIRQIEHRLAKVNEMLESQPELKKRKLWLQLVQRIEVLAENLQSQTQSHLDT